MSAPDHSSKARSYNSHLTNILLPALEMVQQNLAQIEHDIQEYRDLTVSLGQLAKGTTSKQETMIEIGAGVWADADIPDTSIVTLDIGLDLHIDLPLDDAMQYAEKRATILEKRQATIKAKENDIRWQIEQFQGALQQAGNLEPIIPVS